MEDWSVPAMGCGDAGLIWGGFGGEQCSVPLTAPLCHLQPPVVLRRLRPARPTPEASMGGPSPPCGALPRLGNTRVLITLSISHVSLLLEGTGMRGGL